MKKKFYAMALFIMTFSGYGWAQSDSLKTKDLKDMMEMSLEELMNITIVSASKKEESLFDAPLSASVLTKEEIRKSGVTSIMEALRLMPGLIVRETTNGNYNIHIRGLDNVPPNATQSESNNTTTLVMINNRPVFNYQQGDTFWQSLPVDLIDVEKIEVVRGHRQPSTARMPFPASSILSPARPSTKAGTPQRMPLTVASIPPLPMRRLATSSMISSVRSYPVITRDGDGRCRITNPRTENSILHPIPCSVPMTEQAPPPIFPIQTAQWTSTGQMHLLPIIPAKKCTSI